jgi:hypothetical protein
MHLNSTSQFLLLPLRDRFTILAALMLVFTFHLTTLLQPAHAEQTTVIANEYNLKLARMYATAKFINWPDDGQPDAPPFTIIVLAPDPFGGGLGKLDGRKLKDRLIRTQVINSVSELTACHLLFIPSGSDSRLVREALSKVDGQPILVWREQSETTPDSTAACTFVREGDNVIIEAIPSELQRIGLSPDARLMSLNLVRIVKQNR